MVGGGPAGCAAAITASQGGLNVALLEGCAAPRRKAGETLHPGVEAIFEQLGVQARVSAAHFHRHRGVWVEWNNRRLFQSYGQGNGPWLGFQADRTKFDVLLLNAVRALGVAVLQPCRATQILCEHSRVIALKTTRGAVHARWVLDAGGGRHWLATELGLKVNCCSPRLLVRFGWRRTNELVATDPILVAFRDGWIWEAPINVSRTAWCKLFFPAKHAQGAAMDDHVRNRTIFDTCDVTWRLVSPAAGPGYFIIGDAAAVLDPASSHGVLRAMMSGIKAAHAIIQISRGFPETVALREFNAWITDWFNHDVRALKAIYRKHPNAPSWIT